MFREIVPRKWCTCVKGAVDFFRRPRLADVPCEVRVSIIGRDFIRYFHGVSSVGGQGVRSRGYSDRDQRDVLVFAFRPLLSTPFQLNKLYAESRNAITASIFLGNIGFNGLRLPR